MRTPAAAIVVCIGALTAACGVKGPLYLPPPAPKASTPPARQDKPAQPAAAPSGAPSAAPADGAPAPPAPVPK